MTDPHLVQLQWLRVVVWLAQAITLFLASAYLPSRQFDVLLFLLAVGLLLIFSTHIWRKQGTGTGDERVFLAQLLLDGLLLTAMLYVAGGATNPFVSYYLVPVALGAATLSRTLTAGLTLFCLLAYSCLLFWHMPLEVLSPHHHHGSDDQLSLHVIGMWLNFVLSAVLITWFVVSMAGTVRRQRERINQLREQQLMDENIMAVATLAAGATHELGTPLSSLAVMLGDLRDVKYQVPGLDDDLVLMQAQVQRCQQSLSQLAMTAREHQSGNVSSVPVAAFVERLVSHWRVLRPDHAAVVQVIPGPVAVCQFPLTVDQALINLFNNAADAAISFFHIVLAWDEANLLVSVQDDGPGIQPDMIEQRTRVKRSERGMGLGLLLSHATLERAGGQILLSPREGRGTAMEIRVPLLPVAVEGRETP